jgi:hypothetical protein
MLFVTLIAAPILAQPPGGRMETPNAKKIKALEDSFNKSLTPDQKKKVEAIQKKMQAKAQTALQNLTKQAGAKPDPKTLLPKQIALTMKLMDETQKEALLILKPAQQTTFKSMVSLMKQDMLWVQKQFAAQMQKMPKKP